MVAPLLRRTLRAAVHVTCAALLVPGYAAPPAGADPAPAAGTALGTTVQPTHEETGIPGVHVLLDDVEPDVPEPGEPIRLVGRVVNDSGRTVRLGQVTARTMITGLDTRGAVAAWVSGESSIVTPWELGHARIPAKLAAGQEAAFEIEVPADSLQIPFQVATLPLVLEAHGTEAADEVSSSAVLRTVLTVARDEVTTPLGLSALVPLTLPADPALASIDTGERQEAWYDAVGPGSVARSWVDAPALPEATFVVDPALLEPLAPSVSLLGVAGAATEPTTDDATTTASGAASTSVPVTTREPEDTGSEDGEGTENSKGELETEAELVAAVSTLRTGLLHHGAGDPWWLPAHDPDLAAIVELGLDPQDAADVLTDGGGDLPGAGRRVVAWPELASAGASQVLAVRSLYEAAAVPAGLRTVIVPAETLTGGTREHVTRAAVPLLPAPEVVALGYDSRLSRLLLDGDAGVAEAGAGATTQRILAETLAAYQEAPATERSVLLAVPRGTRAPAELLEELAPALADAPWLEPISAADLAADADGTTAAALTGAAPTAEDGLPAYPAPADSPLDAKRVKSLVGLQRDLAGLAEVVDDPAPLTSWDPVLAQLWSTRWRGADGWARSWETLREQSEAARGGVHINPSTVNFLADEGLIQATVVNTLPVAVHDLQVEMVPDSNRLLIVQQPEPVNIGPGSRATVSFRARAVTAGTVTVDANLTSPSGTTFGDQARVGVRVRPTGVWIYWVLGAVAGGVLVLGLVRALRGGTRRRTEALKPPPGSQRPPSSPGRTTYPDHEEDPT